MSAPMHPIEALHAAVNGRLGPLDQVALDEHLAVCAECRRELHAMTALVRELEASLQEDVGPVDLEARLSRALDEEDRQQLGAATSGPSASPGQASAGRTWRWAAAAVAVAAALVLMIVWSERRPEPSAPEQVAESFRRFVTGELVLPSRTTDPAALERTLDAAALGFETRVFDFGMMAYQLVGGGVHRVGTAPSALFAYAGPDALRLLCQMYQGRVDELPPPDQRRSNDGIEFLVYHLDGVTVVFWQEGEILCALAADGNAEAAVKLAFAKAVRT